MPVPAPAPSASLSQWLEYLERLHPATIELGLERVSAVRDRLALAPTFPILTVAGTNGKGSTCAMLESCLSCAGYRVGTYTSPHLLRYNERVRIAGEEASDARLVDAFVQVEHARGGASLTYFEYGTLAAMRLFIDAGVDVAVLEVGLGGRLDAVNAFDADCAIVTSIGLDHQNYLGPTREHIGFEKAGVFRRGRPAVVAEEDPPATLLNHAATQGADLYLVHRDFGYREEQSEWHYWDWLGARGALPWPALRGKYQLSNAAAALAGLSTLRNIVPVDMGAVRRGLVEVRLRGRFEVLPGTPRTILDVAHNPHAAQRLAQTLRTLPPARRRVAVFAMLRDKDIAGVIEAVKSEVDDWLLAALPAPRGADAGLLAEALASAGVAGNVQSFADVSRAYRHARETAQPDDRIVVFGSFYTVAGALGSA